MTAKKSTANLTSRDLQAIERRKQLLDSAKELFALRGYHATTTREITKHIGMADGLIYHYFPDGKKQILDTILQDFLDERYKLVESDIASLQETLPIQELLLSLGSIFLNYIGNDKQVMLILLKEKSVISEEYTKSFNQHVKLIIEQTMRLIQVYVERKEIRSFDIFMMVNQFWSAIYAYILQELFFEENNLYQCDRQDYLQQIVEHTRLTWKM
ncbi:TetR/AcrR family transcriptional regulator [Paenibacillus silvae]|uniref:TetR/AcrR family transcriptional regulator n=1 Tax=Paenibacillus silvae TaxID=1325358 RepID=UPI0011A1E259|nr:MULTISPECIES: TetR/AcrR family transcriptional regulator [Paenibacillus]MCK6077530.1 TetR/AcrR family transcriptional regulator [Paenibacillus silvae]MCK6151738.1 TetR/AcrR family transcriptional regulator [Paenibacillus silvae]MCK6270224.1 TetR/AcrR family transcriptional regulator [Paenibacillus silvae]